MPFLPESIWRRRLSSERDELASAGERFSVSNDLTDYSLEIKGRGLFLDESGNIKESSTHKVRIKLKREYPYAGGIDVVWQTPIFHPNIRSEDGRVCIHLLNQWAEGQTVASLASGLRQLLENPNPKDPLNRHAAEYFIANPGALKDANRAAATPDSGLTKPKILISD